MRTDVGALCGDRNLCKPAPETNSRVILSCGLGLKNCYPRFTCQFHGEFFLGGRGGGEVRYCKRDVMCRLNSCLIP